MKNPPKETTMYRDYFREANAAGQWFSVRKYYFGIFGFDCSIVLGYLMNVGDMSKKEWFRCSSKRIMSDLEITKYQHDKIIRKLESMKVLKRRLIGIPATRYFRVDAKLVEDMITQYLLKKAGLPEEQ